MPYNTTPIAPPKEFSGQASLPLARVKKIIQADDDISACSNNAAFAITIATELFIQHLVEQAQMIVKSERRPRRNIAYKDVANAISRIDNLEFLSDVVPRTMQYKVYKEKKAREENGTASAPQPPAGQYTLDQMPSRQRGEDVDMESDIPNTDFSTNAPQPELEIVTEHPESKYVNGRPSSSKNPVGVKSRHSYDTVSNDYQTDHNTSMPMDQD